MKKLSDITSVESKVKLPEATVETYINSRVRRFNLKKTKSTAARVMISEQYESIDTCSALSPVYGTVEIIFNTGSEVKCVDIPVTTRFLITCTTGKEGNYKLTWSCSLS